MKIVISGLSGFVGQELKQFFESKNHTVVGLSKEDLRDPYQILEILNNSNIVINLSGAPIIKRWTKSYKEELYNSRINTTKKIIEAMNKMSKKPEIFISTSAVGIYSKSAELNTEEHFSYENDFLSNLCQDWEKEALKAKDLGIRTIIFRFGVVLGKNGGAFNKMITPFRLGLGGIIGSGNQNFPFIHIEDLIRAYAFVIDHKNLTGIFNLVSPKLITNREFTEELGKQLNRPTIFPVPEFLLKIIFSEGSKVLTDGQKVIPRKLLKNEFQFKYDNIEKSIKDLIS